MERNSEHSGNQGWEALNGGHRAADDCHAARTVLHAMTTLPPMPARVTTHHAHTLAGSCTTLP